MTKMKPGQKKGEGRGRYVVSPLYACKYCRMRYKEKEWRQECEAWCGKHKSCNIEVIRRAVRH